MSDVVLGLQAFARGVAHISAVTIARELGNLSCPPPDAAVVLGCCWVSCARFSQRRFQRQPRVRRGGITKAGNAHLRMPLWWNRLALSTPFLASVKMAGDTEGVPPAIIEIACISAYMKLSMAAGKDQRKIMTAVARELLGFIWAIAIKAGSKLSTTH